VSQLPRTTTRPRRQADRWAHASPEQFQAELDAYRGKVAPGSVRKPVDRYTGL
jgi:hypothetical protein